jgi:exodeoxyribonuclease VII large subunit
MRETESSELNTKISTAPVLPSKAKRAVKEEPSPQLALPLDAPLVETDWKAKVPSVSQVTRMIRGHIENSFFDVWVRGEISNFRKPVSGHAYFILKDSTAQMKAVMFRGSLSKLKFQLQDGQEVLLHGQVSVYEARGEYQLVADAVEPVGVGALQLAFQQLKEKLQREGLFEAKHKKPLPHLPKKIGIITSATGAAVKDILKVLSRRFYNLEIVILPASVQGEKAAPEICQALRAALQYNLDAPGNQLRPIEVLIVGRGGGSLEDLWPFNEETVARAIFECTIPIISAVGHEIDYTIADFVADLRAPTPSAAAEVVIGRKEELQNLVAHQRTRLMSLMKKQLQQSRLHLSHLSGRLLDPREKVRMMKERFVSLTGRLRTALNSSFVLSRKKLESQVQMLHSLSPLQVLGRGYSLTETCEGKIIRSTSQTKTGMVITTRVGDGEITSTVR